jgi:hypothetical protein
MKVRPDVVRAAIANSELVELRVEVEQLPSGTRIRVHAPGGDQAWTRGTELEGQLTGVIGALPSGADPSRPRTCPRRRGGRGAGRRFTPNAVSHSGVPAVLLEEGPRISGRVDVEGRVALQRGQLLDNRRLRLGER